jgi:Spy/CpxP family protein refolding chaperone
MIALIAVCSAIAGAAIERTVVQKYFHRRPPMRATLEQDARRRAEMLDKMTKDLSLTDAQRHGIDSIMRRTDSLLHGIRTEMFPRINTVFQESRTDMLARLTPEQQEKFKKDIPVRGRRGGGDSAARATP